jgi:hypothetical protein
MVRRARSPSCYYFAHRSPSSQENFGDSYSCLRFFFSFLFSFISVCLNRRPTLSQLCFNCRWCGRSA